MKTKELSIIHILPVPEREMMTTSPDHYGSEPGTAMRIDRQTRIPDWDQSRLSGSSIEIITGLKSPPLQVLAISQACVMMELGEVRLTGSHWEFSAIAIEQFQEAIGSKSRVITCEECCEGADQQIFLPGSGKVNKGARPGSIFGRFTEERLEWSVSQDLQHLSDENTRGNIPFQLVLSGLMLAEALRGCMPLQRWQDSHMPGPLVFPRGAEYSRIRHPGSFATDRKITLAVVGGGALGNWFLFGLQFARIRHLIDKLIIIDGDVITESNLNRQVWFRMEDRGRNKAQILAERLRAVLHGVDIAWFDRKVTEYTFFDKNGLAPDTIISGVDNWEARALLNRYAVASGCTLINGGSDPYSANVYGYMPSGTPCLDCAIDIEKKAADERSASSCGDAEPAVVTTNMIAAGFMLWLLETGCRNRVLHYSINEPNRLGVANAAKYSPGCTCRGIDMQ